MSTDEKCGALGAAVVACPVKLWLGILRGGGCVLGKLSVTFRAGSQRRAGSTWDMQPKSMAVPSFSFGFLFPSFMGPTGIYWECTTCFYSVTRNRETHQVLEEVMGAPDGGAQKKGWGMFQARGGRGQEVDVLGKVSPQQGRCIQLDYKISELEAILKIIWPLSFYQCEKMRASEGNKDDSSVLLICQTLFHVVVLVVVAFTGVKFI